jgi:hypothetical protein
VFVTLSPLWKINNATQVFTVINDETTMIYIFYNILVLNRLPPPRACIFIILLEPLLQYGAMNNKEQGFIGGAAVHKELQGFAAFLAYQSCHQDGGLITKALIEASIGLKYFGNPNDADSIGLVEQLVSGVSAFALLYEGSDTFAGTDPRLRTQPSLLMIPALHYLGGHVDKRAGGPQGITTRPLVLFQRKLCNGKNRSKKNATSSQAALQDQQQDDRIKAQTLLTRAQELRSMVRRHWPVLC